MLRPQPISSVPDDTARVAHAVFAKGHPYLRLADELGPLFTDETVAALFPTHGQPALAPWRLALVTILQFAENLSDRQAADAVRCRIDWKYVIRLDLMDPGFDASVLSEFRKRLVEGAAEQLLLDTLLKWCRERQLLKARGHQRTDSTYVLAAVRALNRIELVGETMRHALQILATVVPDWVRTVAQPEWVKRYTHRIEDDRLPTAKARRTARTLTIGADGYALLAAAYSEAAPSWLRELPAIQTLRRVWIQNYYLDETGPHWRTDELGTPPSSLFISSPYDEEAHYAKKYTTQWIGYKVHLTETCEEENPHLITQVETTPGPVADGEATPRIHAHLQAKDLLPKLHIVDTGYLDAMLLVESQASYGVDLLGPTRPDYRGPARAGEGFDAQHFRIDWERKLAICPEGQTSNSWTPALDNRDNPVIKIKFSTTDCGHCPSRLHCTRSKKKYPRRTITVRPQAQYQALQAARQREHTSGFAALYATRAGIEGTLSRGIRRCGLRRTRYVGQARTHLGHVLTAVGLNFLRLSEWFSEFLPYKPRRSPFAAVMAQVAA